MNAAGSATPPARGGGGMRLRALAERLPRLDGAFARLAADLFAAAVVISVAAALAALTWRIVAAWQAPLPPPPPAPVATTGDPTLGAILDVAPFGRADTAAGATASSLPLELKGTVLADPPSASIAWIAERKQPPRDVGVGDAVAGATVTGIARDHVLLTVGGRTERLGFPQPASPLAASGGQTASLEAAPASPAAAAADTVAQAPAQAAARAAAPSARASTAPPAPPAMIGGAMPSIEQLGESVPDAGFRIGAGLPGMLADSGLMPGDIVEEVNGQRLGDPARDGDLIAAAATAGAAQLTVVRGGQRFTVAVGR